MRKPPGTHRLWCLSRALAILALLSSLPWVLKRWKTTSSAESIFRWASLFRRATVAMAAVPGISAASGMSLRARRCWMAVNKLAGALGNIVKYYFQKHIIGI